MTTSLKRLSRYSRKLAQDGTFKEIKRRRFMKSRA